MPTFRLVPILSLAVWAVAAEAQAPLKFKPVNETTGLAPYYVIVGDVNGDGVPDIVTANITAGTVSVLLGKGHGAFEANIDSPAGSSPRSVAIGDFNGDGKADLAVANGTAPGAMSILLGNGDGTFQTPVSYPIGDDYSSSVTVADFNHDGKLDVAVSNFESGTVSIFLGNGDGTFQPNVDYPVGHGPESVVAADINGDGYPDLAAAAYYGANTSDSGDGAVSVLLGNGDGTFQPAVFYPVGAGAVSLALGDFNGDGFIDVAVANACGADIYCLGGSGSVSILLGIGNGTFQTAVSYSVSADPLGVSTADLNGDGKLDLAVASLDAAKVGVLLGDGDGTFQKEVPFEASSPASIATGTFAGTGTGSSDIVVTNLGDYNTTVATVFLNEAGTGLKLTASPNPVAHGSSTTLTLSVKPAVGKTVPTGSVTFAIGSRPLGVVTLANGMATLAVSTLPIGKNVVTAIYSGNSNFNPNQTTVVVKVEE